MEEILIIGFYLSCLLIVSVVWSQFVLDRYKKSQDVEYSLQATSKSITNKKNNNEKRMIKYEVNEIKFKDVDDNCAVIKETFL